MISDTELGIMLIMGRERVTEREDFREGGRAGGELQGQMERK